MRYKIILLISLFFAVNLYASSPTHIGELDAFLEKAGKIDEKHFNDIKMLQSRADGILASSFQHEGSENQSFINNDEPMVFVLVSMSMPKSMVKSYIHQARQYNASVVLGGLVDNNMLKTKSLIEELVDGKDNAGVVIDPNLFQQYNIKQVPAFLVTNEVYPCNGDGCIPEQYDVLYGAVKLPFALEQIASSGETGYKFSGAGYE